ncbi:hypothetical protein EDC04DRAFT_3093554 [Pisolithus marmoratus]|nr:hypothetical protein EDC04DRAFT_3093554 [Pisolithus marmoratus]
MGVVREGWHRDILTQGNSPGSNRAIKTNKLFALQIDTWPSGMSQAVWFGVRGGRPRWPPRKRRNDEGIMMKCKAIITYARKPVNPGSRSGSHETRRIDVEWRREDSHIPTPPIILFPTRLPGALARDACKAYSPVAAKAVLPMTLHVKQSFSESDSRVVGAVGMDNFSCSCFMARLEVNEGDAPAREGRVCSTYCVEGRVTTLKLKANTVIDTSRQDFEHRQMHTKCRNYGLYRDAYDHDKFVLKHYACSEVGPNEPSNSDGFSGPLCNHGKFCVPWKTETQILSSDPRRTANNKLQTTPRLVTRWYDTKRRRLHILRRFALETKVKQVYAGLAAAEPTNNTASSGMWSPNGYTASSGMWTTNGYTTSSSMWPTNSYIASSGAWPTPPCTCGGNTYTTSTAPVTTSCAATSTSTAGSGTSYTVIVAPTQGVLRYVPFQVLLTPQSIFSKTVEAPFTSGGQNKSFVFQRAVNDTNSTYYYCSTPGHCQKGMFGIMFFMKLVSSLRNPPNAAAGSNMSLSNMMPAMAANSSRAGAMWQYTQMMTQNNSVAAGWGGNIDMSGMPPWAHQYVAENVITPSPRENSGSSSTQSASSNPYATMTNGAAHLLSSKATRRRNVYIVSSSDSLAAQPERGFPTKLDLYWKYTCIPMRNLAWCTLLATFQQWIGGRLVQNRHEKCALIL